MSSDYYLQSYVIATSNVAKRNQCFINDIYCTDVCNGNNFKCGCYHNFIISNIKWINYNLNRWKWRRTLKLLANIKAPKELLRKGMKAPEIFMKLRRKSAERLESERSVLSRTRNGDQQTEKQTGPLYTRHSGSCLFLCLQNALIKKLTRDAWIISTSIFTSRKANASNF